MTTHDLAETAVSPPTRSSKKRQDTVEFWLFVGPLVLGLVAFVYIPILWGFILSFFRARNSVTPTEFVGLQN